MKISKTLLILSILIVVLSATVAIFGLFWQDGGSPFTFTSLRGQVVQMFGRGIYHNDSLLTATTFIGGDAITLFLSIPLLIVSIFLYNRASLRSQFFHLGMLSYFLYVGASAAFIAAYNNLFLVYLALFSASLFAFGFAFSAIDLKAIPSHITKNMPHRGLTAFLLVCSVALMMVWLSDVVGALIQGQAPTSLTSYTTLVTYGLDLGIIAPSLLVAGILTIRRAPAAYPMASTLLILCILIGLVVIAQTVTQFIYGVYLTPGQLIGYAGSFVVMASFAAWLIVLLLRNLSSRAVNA